MTATEELRAMLDERGVEWVRGVYNDGIVEWEGENGRICRAFERNEPLTVDVDILAVTPSQAVEATLGRGECKMQLRDDIRSHAYQDTYECSECGEQVLRETFMGESEPPKYCPNCGAKVVS